MPLKATVGGEGVVGEVGVGLVSGAPGVVHKCVLSVISPVDNFDSCSTFAARPGAAFLSACLESFYCCSCCNSCICWEDIEESWTFDDLVFSIIPMTPPLSITVYTSFHFSLQYVVIMQAICHV